MTIAPPPVLGLLTYAILVSGFALVSAGAQVQQNPDWPCVQVLVPEVSAAVVWDGPSVEGMVGRWHDEPAVAALVSKLTDRRTTAAQADADIEAFARTLEAGKRNPTLARLFAGVWANLNANRASMIEGILNFAREQEIMATQLEDRLAKLDEVARESADADRDRVETLRHQVDLQARIFDSREQLIRYLCEQPIKVEETLGELARAISARLE